VNLENQNYKLRGQIMNKKIRALSVVLLVIFVSAVWAASSYNQRQAEYHSKKAADYQKQAAEYQRKVADYQSKAAYHQGEAAKYQALAAKEKKK
jgi:hypothetical protein